MWLVGDFFVGDFVCFGEIEGLGGYVWVCQGGHMCVSKCEYRCMRRGTWTCGDQRSTLCVLPRDLGFCDKVFYSSGAHLWLGWLDSKP